MLFHFGSAWGGLSFGLAIRFCGSCDGHLLGRRLLIQSSGLANRVNRAYPFRLCLGRFVVWFSDPHLRNFYGHLPLPRSGLPDLGAANRGNRPISLWPLPCSAGRLLCFSEFRQPEAALACAPVAGRLLRPGAHCVLCPPPAASQHRRPPISGLRSSLLDPAVLRLDRPLPRCMRGPQPQPRRPSKFGPQASTSSPTTSMLLSKLESPR